MKHLLYDEIPAAPWSIAIANRHGIFRNPATQTLEIWVLGHFYGDMSAFYYTQNFDKRPALQVIANMLRPLWEAGEWQQALVKELFMPWVGDGRWGTNE